MYLLYLLDTSVLVAAITNESHSQRAWSWLERHRLDAMGVSEWTVTELAAALSFKVRTQQIAPAERMAAHSGFERLLAESLIKISISTEHFQLAASFANQVDSGVRAGDALHLATAARENAVIVTLDKGMARAATVLDVPAELI